MIAHNPLHRSGRAALPHPAPALGADAEALDGPGMADAGEREPTLLVAPKSLPRHSVSLAPTTKGPSPEPCDIISERGNAREVPRYSVVTEVAHQHRPQELPLFRDGIVHAPPQLESQLAQLRVPSCTHRLPQQHATTLATARRDGDPSVAFRDSPARRHSEVPVQQATGSCLSRLNTEPAPSPVNAWPAPSRAPPHDSGPLLVANHSTF